MKTRLVLGTVTYLVAVAAGWGCASNADKPAMAAGSIEGNAVEGNAVEDSALGDGSTDQTVESLEGQPEPTESTEGDTSTFSGDSSAEALAADLDPSQTASPAGSATGSISSNAVGALGEALRLSVERGDVPGLVGLVVSPEGVLFEGAAGLADVANGIPMEVDAIFNIASMTKPVTSVAVMMLLEQGQLQLDDAVSDYLPGFDAPQVLTSFDLATGNFEVVPASNVMTVRHLLSHTSGIGYSFSNTTVAALLQGNPVQEWELPLLNEPGAGWNYSPSTRVLGFIVEELSGLTLEAYFQQNIFVPLEMGDTSFAVPVAKQGRVPTLHVRAADGSLNESAQNGIPATPTAPFGGDGGLYSTAHDYGQFMRMFLNGGVLGEARLLQEETLLLMGENQIGESFVQLQEAANPALTNPFPLGAGVDKFGFGFQITQADAGGNNRRVGSMAWAGLFNTEFWIDPDTGIAATLLMQVLPFYDEGALRSLSQFESSVYEQIAPRL